jgi:molybdopterin-guanine dinucleotide biosynthesis protein A
MRTTSKLLGVVLSGGESRRMGRDKGLLQTDGRSWVLNMGDKLTRHHLPVVYSINSGQIPSYSPLLPADAWVVDTHEQEGPLNGLISVHRRYPDADLLLVACDMQDLDTATIAKLITAWQACEADCYAYEVDGVLQPFCAIYTIRALARTGLETSLKALLHSGTIHRLEAGTAAFRNYNTL